MKNSERKTICADCKYIINTCANPGPASVWHNFFCGAIVNEKHRHLVTGKEVYASDQKHPYCRDTNDGNCEHFELKE